MIRNSLQQGLRLLTLQWIRINSFDILIRFMMVIGNPRLTVHATRHPRNLEEVKITACLVFCQAGNPLRSRAMIPLVPFFFISFYHGYIASNRWAFYSAWVLI